MGVSLCLLYLASRDKRKVARCPRSSRKAARGRIGGLQARGTLGGIEGCLGTTRPLLSGGKGKPSKRALWFCGESEIQPKEKQAAGIGGREAAFPVCILSEQRPSPLPWLSCHPARPFGLHLSVQLVGFRPVSARQEQYVRAGLGCRSLPLLSAAGRAALAFCCCVLAAGRGLQLQALVPRGSASLLGF